MWCDVDPRSAADGSIYNHDANAKTCFCETQTGTNLSRLWRAEKEARNTPRPLSLSPPGGVLKAYCCCLFVVQRPVDQCLLPHSLCRQSDGIVHRSSNVPTASHTAQTSMCSLSLIASDCDYSSQSNLMSFLSRGSSCPSLLSYLQQAHSAVQSWASAMLTTGKTAICNVSPRPFGEQVKDLLSL